MIDTESRIPAGVALAGESDFGWNPFKKKKGKKKKSWFGKALGTAGAVVTAPARVVKPVAKPVNKLGGKLRKVPIVGKAASGVYSATVSNPINLAKDVANGKRIDKAAYAHLKREVKAAQDVAPAAQMAVQFVPGVGLGISGAIGAANALSKGRPITDAFKEAAIGATPGGPHARAALNIVKDIKAHKKPSRIQLKTLNDSGVDGAEFAANLDVALDANASVSARAQATAKLDAQIAQLPPDEQKGLQNGIAIGVAEDLQNQHRAGAGSAGAMALMYREGKALANQDPVLKRINASKIGLNNNGFYGFAVGLSAMSRKQNPTSLKAIEKKVKQSKGEKGLVGFYMAVAYHIGKSTREPLPEGSAYQQFGYYVAEGLKGNTDIKRKAKILKLIAPLSEARQGIAAIIDEAGEAEKSWWARFVEWMGF